MSTNGRSKGVKQLVSQREFIDTYNACTGNTLAFHNTLVANFGVSAKAATATYQRVKRYKAKGLIALDSGNLVESGQILTKTSTYHYGDKETGKPAQWIQSNVPLSNQLASVTEAITAIAETITPLPVVASPVDLADELQTFYISNDVHFGALMWAPESGTDWDLTIASKVVRESYDYLFSTSPNSKVGVVVDLGDLMEVDSFSNSTPKSGNPLTVDGRYPKILRAAYESLIYAIERALEKHEVVHFINISGNHDITTGHDVREIIRMKFADNPRVFINDQPTPIKYHNFGSNLFLFAHGDGMKMGAAGETMAADAGIMYPVEWFSTSPHRFAHFGHNHKDSVLDGKILKAESHRNLAGLNDWAFHMGFRRQLGTMKSITYHANRGEISRNTYNISVD